MLGFDVEHTEKLLDPVGWQILRELQIDARLSYSELGRRVGLSAPAVAERVHRMEEAGIIQGYHASINLAGVGLPVTAFIRLRVTSPNAYSMIREKIGGIPGVLECHRITGDDCYLMKIAVPTIQDIEVIIDRISVYGQTTTTFVLSTPLCGRVIDPPMLRDFDQDG